MRKIQHSKKKKPHHSVIQLNDIDNIQDLDRNPSQNRPFQDFLGLSDEKLGFLYRSASLLLKDQFYQEAKEAFSLLVQVNPYICDFWVGLGMTNQALGDFSVALSDYSMAITLSPEDIEPYWCAIDCCLEAKEFNQARLFLKEAVHYIHKHPRNEKTRALIQEVKKLQKRIEQDTPSGKTF